MSQIPRTTRGAGVPEVTERAPSVASAPREGLPSPSSPPGTSVTLCSARHGSRGAAEEPEVSDVGASRAISPFGTPRVELTVAQLALPVARLFRRVVAFYLAPSPPQKVGTCSLLARRGLVRLRGLTWPWAELPKPVARGAARRLGAAGRATPRANTVHACSP